MEYAIYPIKEMKITQRHDEGNHLAHWNPKADYMDKPWDEGSTDSGKQYVEFQNDFKIVEIIGKDGSSSKAYANSVRVESVNKLKIPYQNDPVILELTFTHIDEDELKKYSVGQILKKGTKCLKEGKDKATANHWHITANKGKYYGIKYNSNKKYVFCYEKSLLPNEAFYILPSWNKILNAKGYVFQDVPDDTPTKVKKITANIRKELDEIDSLMK